MASTEQKAAAKDIIWKFQNKPTPGAFSQFDRKGVANDLLERIENPWKISQQGAGVCSVAAVMYSLAQDRPDAYVRFVTDLYDVGMASIGGMKITPGASVRKYALPTGSPMRPADWIPLASIRDSQNWIFDFDSYKDDDSGSTDNEVSTWFKAFGFSKVDKDVSLTDIFPMNETHLRKASARVTDGYKVVLSVNAGFLTDNNSDGGSPDHHVVLISPVIFGKTTVRMKLFTWGAEAMYPKTGDLMLAKFLKHYYGFIAGKF